MSYFSNLQQETKEELTFDITNLKLAFPNALRRIILAELAYHAIDFDSIKFTINTSMLHNFYLARRLILCPIRPLTDNLENYQISLKIKNEGEGIKNVYLTDFVITNTTPQEFFVFPNILFAKLKPQQELDLTAKLKVGEPRGKNPEFSLVNQATVIYQIDEDELNKATKDMSVEEAQKFREINGRRYFKKNELGEPTHFTITLESIGIFTPAEIMTKAFERLGEKLRINRDALEKDDIQKVQMKRSDKLFESWNFLFIDENDTLGNLINTYLHAKSEVQYSGYLIPHPNDNKMLITMALKEKNTLEENKRILLQTFKEVIELTDKVEDEWKTASTNVPAASSIAPITEKKKTIRIKKKTI